MCMEFGCTQDLADDTNTQRTYHNYGTFNRRCVEYSLYRPSDLTANLNAKDDYDHYSVDLGAKDNYTRPIQSRRTLTTPRRWPMPTS